MTTGRLNLLAILSVSFLCGCQTRPKFNYPAPAAQFNGSGPSIQVKPILDNRNSREMDKVLAKDYFLDVQRAVSSELESMNLFSSVITVTNDLQSTASDFILVPQLNRLEWEIPDYGKLITKTIVVGTLTGAIGGTLYGLSEIEVYGHSALNLRVTNTLDGLLIVNDKFNASITNRLKKAVCDTPQTKASVMIQSFQESMKLLKAELVHKMQPYSTNNPTAPNQHPTLQEK